ncbi:hypothetical protein [Chondromyces crocatus]|uniref:Uncharacterized protein n=1 Tax=Chondromyces crocatus TaxID=52 RepID=A0A0K1EN50_CHOCO|nr:hypothetical protein [Chondromyces crocatus]AKT42330.1 uncharacterized protein CMC5_065560 [Chondromyces crocatus]
MMNRGALVLSIVIGGAALPLGCGGSNPPPPTDVGERQPSDETPRVEQSEGEASQEVETPPSAKPAVDDTIPDDYALSRGDCAQLGKQLAALTHSDQVAQLSSKLTSAQRGQAEKNIADVAARMSDKWIAGCEDALVGKIVERKSIACALAATTVLAFDKCLNVEPNPGQ